MPYYILPKGTDEPLEGSSSFADRANAAQCFNPKTDHIVFRASVDELETWRVRELCRFDDGTYRRVPWDRHYALDHYAHLSTSHPGMVAYTRDIESGIHDKQTRTTPGRYLTQFYADTYSASEIAAYVAQIQADMLMALQIATTPEDIAKVYLHGPSSCMGGSDMCVLSSVISNSAHPATVYGSPYDLAVAYVGELDSASQRAVIWPTKKHHSRIYGTGPLARLLEKAGYCFGSMHGARIRRVSAGSNRLLLPYIDHVSSVKGSPCAMHATDCGSYLVLDDDEGEYECCETSGYVYLRDESDSQDDEEPALTRRCDHCNARYEYENEGNDEYCQSCSDDLNSCSHCSETFFDGGTTVGDDYLCESCSDAALTHCASNDCAESWHELNEFTPAAQHTRETRSLSTFCRTCAAAHIWCDHCESVYRDAEVCPQCNRAPRCTHTGDLLAAPLMSDTLELWNLTTQRICNFGSDDRPARTTGDHSRLYALKTELTNFHRACVYEIVPAGFVYVPPCTESEAAHVAF